MFFLVMCCAGSLFADDTITVHNKTDKPLYVTIYCRPAALSTKVKREKTVYPIESGQSAQVIRPSKSLKCTRRLTFSYDMQEFPTSLKKGAFDALRSIGIGTTSGRRPFNSFYIAEDKQGKLQGYNPISWQTAEVKQMAREATTLVLDTYKRSLAEKSPLVTQNPYKSKVAQVRIGPDISDGEKRFLQARRPKVKQALEKFLSKKLNGKYVPNIAFINSGGGARAFTCALGWHIGAYQIGLLDAITYDIGLSGGSWFVALWTASGKNPLAFRELMEPIMQKGLVPPEGSKLTPSELKLFVDGVLVRSALNQPSTLVNAWGSLLATRYLSPYGAKRQQVMLSELSQRVSAGYWPFPIMTAVNGYSGDFEKNRHKAEWYEFTPYEVSGVGNWLGNAHVPTWAFGRTYKGTTSADTNPEYDIGLLMGICGSAFAFSFARAYEETLANLPVIGPFAGLIIKKIMSPGSIEYFQGKRLSVGKAPNFAKNIPGATEKRENLKLVDAGLAFNLPSPPAHKRADIMIFFDASGGKLGPEFKLAELYAKARGLKFPNIDYNSIGQKAISIFTNEQDPLAPLIIYMPRTKVDGLHYPSSIQANFDTNVSTGKFKYSPQQFTELSDVTATNMTASKNEIREAIIQYIQRRNGFE